MHTTTTALQLCLFTTPTSTQKLRETSPFSEPRQTRRAYTRKDYNYLLQHYREATGPQLAKQLGRTLGSLKGFIRANPELRKRNSHI